MVVFLNPNKVGHRCGFHDKSHNLPDIQQLLKTGPVSWLLV